MDYVRLQPLPQPARSSDLKPAAKHFKGLRTVLDLQLNNSTIPCMEFNPAKLSELAVCSGTRVEIYNIKNRAGRGLAQLNQFKDFSQCVSYRFDGKLLACGDATGQVQIFDRESKKVLRRFKGHTASCGTARFGGKASLLTGAHDKSLRLWDIETGECVTTVENSHDDFVRTVRPAPMSNVEDGASPNLWLTGGYDGIVKLWDNRVGDENGLKAVMTLDHGAPVEDVLFTSSLTCFSAGGPCVAAWDLAAGKRMVNFATSHTKTVSSMAYNAKSSTLLTASLDGTAKIHDLATHEVLLTFNSPDPLTACAVSSTEGVLSWGSATGRWICKRNGARKGGLLGVVAAEKKKPYRAPLQQQSITYLKRGPNEPRQEGATKVAANRKQQSFPDRLFRKFEYAKVMDAAIASRADLCMSFAIVDELIQQGALEAALRERSDSQCTDILHWAEKMLIRDPQYAGIVLEVVHTLVEANSAGCFADPSPDLYKSLARVDMRTQQEMFHQAHLTPVLGLLDLVLA